MKDPLVLVTGGSGFLGSHTIVALLDRGYRVRATVRPGRESTVRALVGKGGAPGERLSFAVADLNSDGGWDEAMSGCHGVIHVASPFFQVPARRENELIVPAREGTLRVLRAARNAGVRRVVLTSSSEAVVHGRAPDRSYTEEDWSNPDHRMSSYGKSKVLAERAAWDFVSRGGPELAVVNPVGIYGPPLGTELSTSVDILAQMLAGRVPRLPRMGFDVVDVRDVADLHVRALESPGAVGQRFLATAGTTSLVDIARLLKKRLGPVASRVSDKTVPDWVMRLAGLFVPELAQVGAYLGTPRVTTAEKARRLLDWNPRSVEEAILASAEALVPTRA